MWLSSLSCVTSCCRSSTRRIRSHRRACAAAADPSIEPPGEGLGGKALVEVAVRVLADSDKAQPIHYRDWLQLVRLAGYSVGGAEPQATFLTAISRDERIESIGGRTGLWKLADGAE